MTVVEMARQHDVVERTIRRDLDLMRSVGLPLVESVGDYGRKSWGLDTIQLARLLGFSAAKVVAQLRPVEGDKPTVPSQESMTDGDTAGGH